MNRFLLDTNSVIYALKYGYKLPKHNYFVSIISEMELLAYPRLSNEEEKLLRSALSNFTSVTILESVKEKTIEIRKNSNLKLPDSIIVATAIVMDCSLVTSDKKILNCSYVDTVELIDLLQ